MKTVRFSLHAQNQLLRRGAAKEEVVEAIRSSSWEPADRGRLACRKNFPYHDEWNGKVYETKQVRPIFVDEADEIVVVTVYSYFF